MLKQISKLFHRFHRVKAKKTFPGFVMHDEQNSVLGVIETIEASYNGLNISGWTICHEVGLESSVSSFKTSPFLHRDDVVQELRSDERSLHGFELELPSAFQQTHVHIKSGSGSYSFALPEVTEDDFSAQKLSLIPTFLARLIRALLPAIHWLIYRDDVSGDKVDDIFELYPNRHTHSKILHPHIFDTTRADRDLVAQKLANEEISIIIPVYNAFDLLPELLDRVLNNTDMKWRLIIVEDCSSDAQVRPWLKTWYDGLEDHIRPQIDLVENEKNLGFIRSVNHALEIARGHDNHIVLLNSDAFVPKGWATRLIAPFVTEDNAATVTPMSNDAEICNVPIICHRLDLLPGEAEAIDKAAQWLNSYSVTETAPTGVGFCMAMSRDYVQQCPQLDTSFGHGYGEEVDWCQRVAAMGGKHLITAGLFVEHRGGVSFGSEQKLELIRKSSAIITARYPLYNEAVQTFIKTDPLATQRLILAMAWANERQTGPLPIYVAHAFGGGANLYLENRIAEDLNAKNSAIVLRVGSGLRWKVELHTCFGTTNGQFEDASLLHILLKFVTRRLVVYSCAVGDKDPIEIPALLLSLLEQETDELEVLVHDYFMISPSHTLLDSNWLFQGVPNPDETKDQAHEFKRPDESLVSLSEWQDAWRPLLTRADRVVTFSQSSRDLLSEAYPDLAKAIIVQPHHLLENVEPVQALSSERDEFVIGVLGNIGRPKGADVLKVLSDSLEKRKDARLVVIGAVDTRVKLAPKTIVHGRYSVADISRLAEHYHVNCWLIPSICPETFSYATHETLATGLPVWAFELGAQGEATKKAAADRGQGGVLPLTAASQGDVIADIILTGNNSTLS